MAQLSIIGGLSDFLSSWFMDTILSILSFIPKIVYFLVACLLSIIDMFQVAVRKLAGLDPIMIGDEIYTGDSVYEIITKALFDNDYPAIKLIFWSLIVLGIFMLIVTSIIATIRLEYAPDKEKGNSKGKIISNFIKALFTFFIIPVASVFGMYFSNLIVKSVDTVITNASINVVDDTYTYFDTWDTSDLEDGMVDNKDTRSSSYISYNIFGINIPTTTEPFSGMVFKASAYNCNRFRRHGLPYLSAINESGTDLGIFSGGKVNEPETAANIIDTGFAINAKAKVPGSLDKDSIPVDYYRQGMLSFFGHTSGIESFSKYNVEQVWYFYDLWTFNYIVAFVALIVIAKLYASFCMALMARIFELLTMFIFAPVAIGLMPIDNGGAIGRWKTSYIAKYGLLLFMVFGLNMVTPIIEIMNTIKLFGLPVIDYIINVIIVVAALSAVDSLNKSLASILLDKAGEAAYGSISDIAKNTSSNMKLGVGSTLKAAQFAGNVGLTAGKLGFKGAKLGAKTVGSVSGGIKRGISGARENASIKNRVGNDRMRDWNALKNLNADERRESAEKFLKTEEGKKIIDKFGGNEDDAMKAIMNAHMLSNSREDKVAAFASEDERFTADDMHSFAKFNNEYKNFETTDEAKKYERGSEEYNQAFNNYREMSTKDKVNMHRGSQETLSEQQAGIREKRQKWESRVQKRKERIEKVGSGIVKVGSGVAKGAKWTAEKVKPFTGGLGSMLGLIPGMSLFKKDK